MTHQKHAVAIHDVSGIGKCSLTVALPILSAAGIETSALPTALLSTHTGNFTDYSFLDLTDEMPKIIKHWKSLDINFDAIYSGYLGSFAQLNTVSSFIDDFKKKDTVVLVDPVMGDAGRYYAGFEHDFAKGMLGLCRKADIIVPNFTEAYLLLGEEYRPAPYTEKEVIELMKRLSNRACPRIVLTGIDFTGKKTGAAAYDATNGNFNIALTDRIDGFYHGTGDVFASALLAAYLNNNSLVESAALAVDFTTEAIKLTYEAQTDTRYGVNFEAGLPRFMHRLGLI